LEDAAADPSEKNVVNLAEECKIANIIPFEKPNVDDLRKVIDIVLKSNIFFRN